MLRPHRAIGAAEETTGTHIAHDELVLCKDNTIKALSKKLLSLCPGHTVVIRGQIAAASCTQQAGSHVGDHACRARETNTLVCQEISRPLGSAKSVFDNVMAITIERLGHIRCTLMYPHCSRNLISIRVEQAVSCSATASNDAAVGIGLQVGRLVNCSGVIILMQPSNTGRSMPHMLYVDH